MAKVRNGFVTNSSSSSFVIEKKSVSRGNLLEILLEIANETSKKYSGREEFDWEDVNGTCVAWDYHVREADHEYPYWGPESKVYENHYIIDNDGCSKYDWDVVNEVLKRHNIEWQKGWSE